MGRNWNYQSFNTTPCGKVNFSIIHPTHITIHSFWRGMFSTNISKIIGKGYILTTKSNYNWTFLIFFVFNIVFSFGARD